MSCTKELSIEVTSTPSLPPLEWWRMDEAGNAPRVGAVNGIVLSPFNLSSGPGVIGNATEITGQGTPVFDAGFAQNAAAVAGLAYQGTGVTVLAWVKIEAGTTGLNILAYWFDNGSTNKLEWSFMAGGPPGNMQVIVQDAGSGASGSFTAPYAPTGAFQFFQLYYDPATNIVGFRINNGVAVTGVVGGGVVPVKPSGKANFVYSVNPAGVHTTAICEWAVYPFVLTEAQRDYIYSGGSGMTWPVVLP